MKKLLRDGDVISGSFLAVFGSYVVMTALKWNYVGSSGPGPGFFPFWYGVVIIVLSVFLVANRALHRPANEETPPGDRAGTARALLTIAALVIAVAIIGPLGFLSSYAILSLFLMVVVFRRPVLESVIFAVLSSAAFYAVFVIGLQLRLPTGFLGI